jgi:hypothetical protein
MLMRSHVASAPAGAASEKMARWVRAMRFERPFFRRTEVRPNAAGALWSMSARKTMRLRLRVVVSGDDEASEDGGGVVVVVAAEAPRAIPSATEWMTRPMVVERALLKDVEACREFRGSSWSSAVGERGGEMWWLVAVSVGD